MKTLQLSIIAMVVCIVILPSVHNVKANPYMSPQDLYKASETVFYGQVISKQAGPGPDYYYYQIKVQTYFKNPQTSDSITVAGHKSSEGHVTYPQFEIGDKAIFYITKIDGINTISPYSQKAGDACDVNSFLGPGYFGSGNSHGGAASNPRITDVNGNVLERILTNQEIMLSYDDVWNNYPESRTIPASILIQNADNGKQVFNNTQNLQVQACNFAGNLKWNFTPTQIGNYVAKMDVDNKTKLEMGFSVIFDSSANSKIILSPLKQLKSGIAANNVKCQQDLQLVIKEEDGSPACVKSNDILKFSERGWAVVTTGNQPSSIQNTNQTANPFGIAALIEYAPIDMGLGTGPNYHFYLKINSNSTAYLLGYNICGKDFCVKNDNLSILIPKTNIGMANYTRIGLSENLTWNYGDTADIQLEISPTTDNKTAYFLNIKNSTIVP